MPNPFSTDALNPVYTLLKASGVNCFEDADGITEFIAVRTKFKFLRVAPTGAGSWSIGVFVSEDAPLNEQFIVSNLATEADPTEVVDWLVRTIDAVKAQPRARVTKE